MKEQIKQLRVRIDGISQLVKELKPIENVHTVFQMPNKEVHNYGKITFEMSDELRKCFDSLILSKAWLGKVLRELGEETPYKKDGDRHSIEDIEKTADVHRGVNHLLEKGNWNTDYNYIEKIDWLRQGIGEVIKETHIIGSKIVEDSIYNGTSLSTNIKYRIGIFIDQHLSEARFWLGFELQRIKEENEKRG